ncbi:class I SAM-dependent methyltransferase [Sulfuracidifex tepidarius]|uniref:Ubiquinone/menaquinone biosynthesis C-methyltransferase UbiE n=1 Tax=Sulfuracidifex tepidarius TaxID=1294262 RepID=A0A510DZT6_9CREN|nr:class I SAM-dependent methyltransferase [Sulfuracidifex tepidarius]BBG25460.1 Ubiquinone/menaquinone biosynthesis C-methyltransferase UbiE [Sulfuracidifex tepidarius]BBG28254.1 Ubiquinone/menaquinone biosynthesis C-methyltransferase UbiE [Sulfuracidifex tepidarius]
MVLKNYEKMIDFLMSDKRKQFEDPDLFLPKFVKNNDVVVDIGCGPGFYCIRLIKIALKVYCIDNNQLMLDTAKRNCKNDKVQFFESVKLVPSNTIDLVLMANSFHDMENKEEIYEEIKRISKRNSRILIVDWKKDTRTEQGPPYYLRMSEEDYVSRFPDYVLKERFEVGPYHFGLLFERVKS